MVHEVVELGTSIKVQYVPGLLGGNVIFSNGVGGVVSVSALALRLWVGDADSFDKLLMKKPFKWFGFVFQPYEEKGTSQFWVFFPDKQPSWIVYVRAKTCEDLLQVIRGKL